MEYISVIQFAEKYGISERTARNYCALGKIEGAFLTGKTWNIPADAALPQKGKKKISPLLHIITEDLRLYYYRGIQNWEHTNGYLQDTCLTAQDNYKALLDYFKIKH